MKNLITKKLALLAIVLFASIGSAFGQSIDVTLTGVDNSGDLCADVSLMSNSMSDPRWTSGHDQFSFSEGEDVTMKVYVYNSLYSIKSIHVDNVDLTNEIINNENSYTFSSLSGNHTVNIVFDKKPTQNVQVTISHPDVLRLSFSGDGYWHSISESQTVEVPDGKSIWMSFSYLSSAYPIKSVVIDGNNVTDQFLADKGYSFQNISGAHSVNIELDKLQSHTISFIQPDESFWPNVYFVDGNSYINGYEVVLAAGHTVKMFITLPAGYQINTVNVKDSQEHTLDVNTVTNSILTNGYYEFTELSDNYVVTITYQTVDKYTITANFDDEKGWVNYMINGNGSGVSPNDPIAFNKGTTVRYIAGGNSNYKVKSFLVDGVDKTSEYLLNNYYEFSNLGANHAVEVQYRESAPVTISYTFNREELFGLGIIWDNGSMSLSNSQSIELPEGSFVRLYFSWIDDAYKIKAIKVDGVDVVTETFMTDGYLLSNITSDHSVDIQLETKQPSYAMNVTFNHDGFGDVCFDDSHYNRCVNYAQTVDVAAGEDIWVNVNLFSLVHPLKSIKVDDTDVTNDVKQYGGYSIPNISSNHSVYVEFDELPYNTISVNWQEGNADVYFEEGNFTMWGQEAQIVSGHNAKMFIIPTAGYAISNVIISDGSSTQDITDTFNANGGYYEFTSLNTDYTVTVQFTEVETRTITLSFDNEKGSVYINGRWVGPYEYAFNEASTIRLTTSANQGYKVGSIVVGEDDVTDAFIAAGYCDIVMNSDYDISVNFVDAAYYTISVTCDDTENGSYWISHEGQIVEGTDVDLNVEPHNGFMPKVTINGTEVDLIQGEGSYHYVINNLDADQEINVAFDPVGLTPIHVVINENETKVVYLSNNSRSDSGDFELTTGSTVRLVAYPQLGYELESIYIDDEDITESYIANGYYDLVVTECTIIIDMKNKPVPQNVSFTLPESGIGTFCCEFDLDFSSVRGIKAYVASGFNPNSGQLVLTKVDEVPAGTGVLIKGTANTYQIPTNSTYFCYANMLKGVVEATYIFEGSWEDGWNNYCLYVNYILGTDGEFYKTTGEELPANSAYLMIPSRYVENNSLAKISTIFLDDEEEMNGIATGIGFIKAGEPKTITTNDDVYNLQGQKVNSKTLKPGIYIKNGKKFMVK